jgi:hypothetical protein
MQECHHIIQNTVVYVLYVCRLALENGRDTERLSPEQFTFSTL